MKKNVITTTLTVLLFITITAVAQVKPKITVKTSKSKVTKVNKSLRMTDLNKLKSVEDLNKLNIPLNRMTQEKLRAKPIKTWQITPQKLNDGFLKFESIKGAFYKDTWLWGRNVDRDLQSSLDQVNSGDTKNERYDFFPFKIKFRVTAGVEYRLKIKQHYAFPESRSHYIYVAMSTLTDNNVSISKINNDNNVFNYVFKVTKSGEVIISFSGIPLINSGFNDGRGYWEYVSTYGVRIDRIN
ncbi:hypothetical protein EGM88_04745 [Aureibaculum marinum]|uniref:Uncharacterized protein n=1 Tax=Aureibaculum marinum TaxID=2487930 RepID=A0A3N4PG64_9FLAO|nr:hypothetical protein [Aureibaculum marinum]RPD98513.1 hypothetical protein EGM88_04745 [Aureibaculum marinum]